VTFLRELGHEIQAAVDQSALPHEDVDELFDLYALLLLALGEEVTLCDVHNAWTAWMTPRDPAHPSLVPFDDLAPSVQAEDQPFVDAIREVARRQRPPLGRVAAG
jgi:hypothetical protein